ncbi:Hsp20/alpha crystallin family protein [Metabacillus fastidiosus]|uniref:Hsp20/alpha crystallin family protein n=1 Tax=Metabacillus fastidiosus TaxID=1458 RepID=UPI002E213F40|nr:Hsp20/alpha crystallin family protein [Metabacillus fastidiosus]
MEIDKLMQWMELAKKYQKTDFWDGVFDHPSFSQFMKEQMNMDPSTEPPEKAVQEKNFPPIDIYITDKEVIVLANLAGYIKENLHVSLSGTKLLLSGVSKPIITGQPTVQERFQGDFKRIIELPEPTDPNKVHAKFENGLLILSYKRKEIHQKRVNIE